MQRSIVLSELRARVTGASVDYVGSVTIHEELCDALGLLDRQMVHIRNHTPNENTTANTPTDLWTYVIRGSHDDETCPKGTVCLNGAAAHLVHVDDIVTITARGLLLLKNTQNHTNTVPRSWDAVQDGVENVTGRCMGGVLPSKLWMEDALLEFACGKVHRPRITALYNNSNDNDNTGNPDSKSLFPALFVDQNWAEQGGIQEGEAIHLVNVTNGKRDILTLQYAPRGSQECSLHNAAGYSVGDVIIAMNYGIISRGAIIKGEAPPMQICFPFERPAYCTDKKSKECTATPTATTQDNGSESPNAVVDLNAWWDESIQNTKRQKMDTTSSPKAVAALQGEEEDHQGAELEG